MLPATRPFRSDDEIDRENRDIVEEFAEQADVVDSTRAKYRVQLAEFRSWLNHPRVLSAGAPAKLLVDADARDVQRFMSYLRQPDRFAASEHAATGRVLSASSRKNFFGSLRSFFSFVVRMRLAAFDPTAGIRAPRVSIPPGLRLSAREMRLLLDAPGSSRERVAAYLLAYTAARAGSLRNLRWHDIDFQRREIQLVGKRDKVLVLHIHPRLMTELRRWFIQQELDAQRCPGIREAKERADTDFVLLTKSGKQLAPNVITQELKARATRVGLHLRDDAPDPRRSSRVSAHTLRRSVASLLLNEGMPIDAVADMLNHDRVDTTRKHYAFSSSERQRFTVEAISL
jgi:integrase/recombinase XerD